MKKVLFLLLLCPCSAFMSDKNEKLEQQLSTIQQHLLKWNEEINNFQKWDLDNNGILDDTEKAALNSRKAEIAQILKRLEHIAKLKGLNLPLVALDVKDSNTVIPKKGFAETVEEIIKSYLGFVNQFYLKEQKDLSIMLNNEWAAVLNTVFTHDDQIITDLKADFLKVLNKSGAKTMGELADLLIEMLGTYNKDYIAKYYGKEYKGKAITPEIIKGMFPDAAKLKKAIESGIDKTDPKHPEMIVFYQWCSKLTGQLKLYRGDTPQWLNTNATNLADYLKRHFAFAPLLGDIFVKNISGEKLPSVAVYDRLFSNMKEIEKMNLNELALGSDKFKFLPEDTVIINDIKRCELPAENPVMETDPKKFAERLNSLLAIDSAKVSAVFDHPSNGHLFLFNNKSFKSSLTTLLSSYNDCDRYVVGSVVAKAFDAQKEYVTYCQDMQNAFSFAISTISSEQAKYKFFEYYIEKKAGLPSSLNLDVVADSLKRHIHEVSAQSFSSNYAKWSKAARNYLSEIQTANGWQDSTKFNTDALLKDIAALFGRRSGGEAIANQLFENQYKSALSALSKPKFSLGELKSAWINIFDTHSASADIVFNDLFSKMLKDKKTIAEILAIQDNFINDLPDSKEIEQVLRSNKEEIVLPIFAVDGDGKIACTVLYKNNSSHEFIWTFQFDSKIKWNVDQNGNTTPVVEITGINNQNSSGKGATLSFGASQSFNKIKVIDAYKTLQPIKLQLKVQYDKSEGKTIIPAGWSGVSYNFSGGVGVSIFDGSLSREISYSYEQEETNTSKEIPETYLLELEFNLYAIVDTDAAYNNKKYLTVYINAHDLKLSSKPEIDQTIINDFSIKTLSNIKYINKAFKP